MRIVNEKRGDGYCQIILEKSDSLIDRKGVLGALWGWAEHVSRKKDAPKEDASVLEVESFSGSTYQIKRFNIDTKNLPTAMGLLPNFLVQFAASCIKNYYRAKYQFEHIVKHPIELAINYRQPKIDISAQILLTKGYHPLNVLDRYRAEFADKFTKETGKIFKIPDTHLDRNRGIAIKKDIREKCYTAKFENGKIQNKLPGKYLYVIGANRHNDQIEMYLAKDDSSQTTIKHSSFTKGHPVICAGTLIINKEGEILQMTNDSGHYRPTDKALQAADHWLKTQGVIVQNLILQYLRGPI